jgi:hypothetical protein
LSDRLPPLGANACQNIEQQHRLTSGDTRPESEVFVAFDDAVVCIQQGDPSVQPSAIHKYFMPI